MRQGLIILSFNAYAVLFLLSVLTAPFIPQSFHSLLSSSSSFLPVLHTHPPTHFRHLLPGERGLGLEGRGGLETTAGEEGEEEKKMKMRGGGGKKNEEEEEEEEEQQQ